MYLAKREKIRDTGSIDGTLNAESITCQFRGRSVSCRFRQGGVMLWPAPCYHDGNGAPRTQPNPKETS
ncbi:hypothetical protein D3C78_1757200 [compost metagenome]